MQEGKGMAMDDGEFLDSLFSPEFLTASQYGDLFRSRTFSPRQRLAIATLRRAALDYRISKQCPEVVDWVEHPQEGYWPFAVCCELLGVEVELGAAAFLEACKAGFKTAKYLRMCEPDHVRKKRRPSYTIPTRRTLEARVA
jgi:hypothetical protein